MDPGIIVQPPTCGVTGKGFSTSRTPVFLKCGCVMSAREADQSISESGFVSCPICDQSYTVRSKSKAMTDNTQLTPDFIKAQEKRCAAYEAEIAELQKDMDTMILEAAIEFPEGADMLEESDPSSVEDDSDLDSGDFMSFSSTLYALFQKRLFALIQSRDALLNAKADRLRQGSELGAPWVSGAWQPEEGSLEAAQIAKRTARREERRLVRRANNETAKGKYGANKVVHNVHVLGKLVPKKWRDNNPNITPAADFAEKAREKQGWLTADEEENMDEDEQASVIEQRRAEWKAEQSKVPPIFGSVKRQRWAGRLYSIARRRHFIKETLSVVEDEAQKKVWQGLLDAHETRLADTRAKCAARVAAVEGFGKYDKAASLEATFATAEKIGADEIAAEIEAKAAAEAAAKAAEEAAAEAVRKAEEKAAAKAEAEARGETWVDPDAGENEGDEEEEEN